MPKKIALDYDESELRIVVANCNGSRVNVTAASVIAIGQDDSVSEKLRKYVTSGNLQKTETLVAIGRGKAELRELQLPPVPEDDLPDMVRFQAIRSFASATDRALVDFLVTKRASEGNTLIAAAVAPTELDQVRELCNTSELITKRVALRPLTAASLYLSGKQAKPICVMIDLLNDDAEIVIARDGNVIFVRTVRLPSDEQHRSNAIASELKRTMIACGETSTPDQIVVWGTEAVHAADLAAIQETIDCDDVRAVNPFDLVSVQIKSDELPEHLGRLAPLVGLLASDEAAPETLIDFLNPRRRPEQEPDRIRRLLMIAGPIAAIFLIGFFVYRQFSNWDQKIASATEQVNQLLPQAETADKSIARTEQIDKFLDSDVNWLDELRRVAEKIPPSEELIVKGISANAETRLGGGNLVISGAVTQSNVIDSMEESLRDETHRVVGKGFQEQKGSDAYRLTFTETIAIDGSTVRNTRYLRMDERLASEPTESAEADAPQPQSTAEDEDAEPSKPPERDGGSDQEQPPSAQTDTSNPSETTEESSEVQI